MAVSMGTNKQWPCHKVSCELHFLTAEHHTCHLPRASGEPGPRTVFEVLRAVHVCISDENPQLCEALCPPSGSACSQPTQSASASIHAASPSHISAHSGSSPLLATRCRLWLEASRTGDPGGLTAAHCVPAKPGCLAGHWKKRSTSGAWFYPADVKVCNFHKETVESNFLLKTTASIYYLCSSI